MSTTKRAMHGRSPMVEAAVEAAAMVKTVMVKAVKDAPIKVNAHRSLRVGTDA
ncbi:hypothetical protein RN347_06080 [Halomonas sp. PAMB 3264]|uniref:hypothetical protein n=1 Tax=unclassified Halomonas TaxID=2609666 RepID=UPI0028A198ED|nr:MULTISPECIES: hypothetical protein [unclassified Halomonas]WNL40671.1 hypothetical protein RN346_06230 [Halomonas sp. PAMB 3232]WNL43992.1 hypothetical protein RN347_06080 [Halomonas sp. PAMB 3264]